MMLERYSVRDGHISHLVVSYDVTGWNVREERDSIVVHEAHHHDWHRVERAVQVFEYAAVVLNEREWNQPTTDRRDEH